MQEYIIFFTAHWILASIFGVLLVAYILMEMFYKENIKVISPQRAVALINHEHGLVLDVRAQEAFIKGHIVGAINIPGQDLQQEVKKLQRYIEKPVIVTCSTGRDAKKIAGLLENKGFKQVVQMSGGIENWIAAGLPLVSK